MKIEKKALAVPGGIPTPEQLEKVNQQSKSLLAAEEIYVFSVRLCDDQIDRDGERFDTAALETLGRLFVGKPGIVDHNWSAEKQVARIFDTEVIQENGISWLKAWAYIPRAGREELIRDIESGIRKEVSISCAMGGRKCSLCGEDIRICGHQVGSGPDGEICTAILTDPVDAYEFSFVAVPAQPMAGVVKNWKGGETMNLHEYVDKAGSPALQKELEQLKRMASYGAQVRKAMEDEVIRMCLALKLGLDRQDIQLMAEALELQPLEKLKKALEKEMCRRFPGKAQLNSDLADPEDAEAYLI